MLFHNACRDAQAETRAIGLGGEERVEQAALGFGGNAPAGVRHFDDHVCAAMRVAAFRGDGGAQGDESIVPDAFRSVLYQVDQHLLDLGRINVDFRIVDELQLEPDGGLCQGRTKESFEVPHQTRGANCGSAPVDSTVCQSVNAASFHLWTPPSNLVIGLTQVVAPLTLMLAGALAGNEQLLEASTLAAEALLVAQAYHVTLKLLTGREGTLSRTGAGTFHGPTKLSFPDGFPSGHAASLFALIGAYSTYVDAPWLHVLLLGVGAALVTWLVLDDYHFVSEVFFGATTGYLVGRWVVRHRRALPPSNAVTWQAVTPVLSANGAGLASTWTF